MNHDQIKESCPFGEDWGRKQMGWRMVTLDEVLKRHRTVQKWTEEFAKKPWAINLKRLQAAQDKFEATLGEALLAAFESGRETKQ